VLLIGAKVSSVKKPLGRAHSILAVAALALGLGGCDSSTTLVVTVDVRDNSVPHFTQLVIDLSSVADPSRQLSQMFLSTAPGYGVEGGLPAVILPRQVSFTLEPSYLSGEVLVEAEGLEIYGATVLAGGTATANVVAHQTTAVTVTLHGVATCSADGGVADAASPCDGGADGAPRN
jgi:hypothetical protein